MEKGSRVLDGGGSHPRKGTMPKKSVRNVLDTPYPPRSIPKDDGAVAEILMRLTPIRRAPPIQWKFLKEMAPEERQRVRKEARSHTFETRQHMLIGMNEVLRGMEDGILASVILNGDVKPISLVNCFKETAANHQIPIITVPSLGKLAKDTLGIHTSALGVKKTAAENGSSNLHKLHEAILHRYKEMKLPDHSVQFQIASEEAQECNTGKRPESVKTCRKNCQPYLRSYYCKRPKSTGIHGVDEIMDEEKQDTTNSNASIENSKYSTTLDQIFVSKHLKRYEDQENKNLSCSYKPLRVKEVIYRKQEKSGK